MSYACVCIFAESHEPGQGWLEMLDTLDEAATYLKNHPTNPLVAYEIGEHGDPTGVVLRLAREGEVDFLMNDRDEQETKDEGGPKQALD